MDNAVTQENLQKTMEKRRILANTEAQKKDDIVEIGINALMDNPYQPRVTYKNIEELGENIREIGQIQAITITEAPEKGKYYIVAGHRRTRAAIAAGLMTVRAVIKTKMTDQELRDIAMAENLHREQLSPAEISLHIKTIEADNPKIQKQEIARILGISQSSVSNYTKASSLNADILHRMEKTNTGRDILILLSKIEDPEILEKATSFIENNPDSDIKEITANFSQKKKQNYKVVTKATSSTVFFGITLGVKEQEIVNEELKKAMLKAKQRIVKEIK